jgi:hypothetical protein
VWRITDEAPMGTYVDVGAKKDVQRQRAPEEVCPKSWVDSSFDLLNGIDVMVDPITNEQLQALFGDDEVWPSTRPTGY